MFQIKLLEKIAEIRKVRGIKSININNFLFGSIIFLSRIDFIKKDISDNPAREKNRKNLTPSICTDSDGIKNIGKKKAFILNRSSGKSSKIFFKFDIFSKFLYFIFHDYSKKYTCTQSKKMIHSRRICSDSITIFSSSLS